MQQCLMSMSEKVRRATINIYHLKAKYVNNLAKIAFLNRFNVVAWGSLTGTCCMEIEAA